MAHAENPHRHAQCERTACGRRSNPAEDGASAAYERLASHKDCGLRGLGPAFGTKYIYFIQPRDQAVRALIFDRLVADWLGRETNLGLSAGAWSVAMYARYLDAMHAWASSLGCQPDDVETCIPMGCQRYARPLSGLSAHASTSAMALSA